MAYTWPHNTGMDKNTQTNSTVTQGVFNKANMSWNALPTVPKFKFKLNNEFSIEPRVFLLYQSSILH